MNSLSTSGKIFKLQNPLATWKHLKDFKIFIYTFSQRDISAIYWGHVLDCTKSQNELCDFNSACQTKVLSHV